MRKMTKDGRKQMERDITEILCSAVGSDYVRYILEDKGEDGENETFMESVIDDVLECSAWDEAGFYNDDDIRLAIGRTFMSRMNIIY